MVVEMTKKGAVRLDGIPLMSSTCQKHQQTSNEVSINFENALITKNVRRRLPLPLMIQ